MWLAIDDKNKWNKMVSSQPHSRFLQSWEWGEFQEALGRKVARLAWGDLFLVQAIRISLTAGQHYWYIPHTPVVTDGSEDTIQEALASLETELTKDSPLFLRIDPVRRFPAGAPRVGLRFVSATQPQCTSVLGLNSDENTLLGAMRQKTRYNIRLAEKKGVVVSEGAVDDFIVLNHETTARDRFVSHPDEYYKIMTRTLPKEMTRVYKATYDGKVVASLILVLFGDTVTYAHGASSNTHREAMAPYLLQWHAIQDAKFSGARYYDFWGANPDDHEHPAYKRSWEGITRFKAGFSGTEVCYPQSFDLINKKAWYTVYRLSRALLHILK